MILHLKIIGLILMSLALLHAFFPRYFDWAEEFRPLSMINRQMMYVHTLFLAVTVFLMGLLSFTCSEELIQTSLGAKIALGFSTFWVLRLVIQFWGYSSELWRGKVFETAIHILFSVLWAYIICVFFIVYWTFIHHTLY